MARPALPNWVMRVHLCSIDPTVSRCRSAAQYMEASDASGQELNDLDDELAAAAAEERYADAAGVKARMTALSEGDVGSSVMVQMDELLENERSADSTPVELAAPVGIAPIRSGST